MLPWLEGAWNPDSLHREGRRARAALDAARERIAALWSLRPREVIFTGSGSESVSLALLGAAESMNETGTFITSTIEHHAVRSVAGHLAESGWRVEELPTDTLGRIDLADLARRLEQTIPQRPVIFSLMLVNNEIGTITPFAEAARIARMHGAYVHTDAIGAGESCRLDDAFAYADAISLAAQKCGGPSGVGLLLRRGAERIRPRTLGGGQEFGIRAGTPNLAAIVGAAEAFAMREAERPLREAATRHLQHRLEDRLRRAFPPETYRLTAAPERSPAITHLAFADLDAASLLAALDLAGLAASAGSACAAGALEPSHVARAVGIDTARFAPLRLSWSATTAEADIDEAVDRLIAVVKHLQGVAVEER